MLDYSNGAPVDLTTGVLVTGKTGSGKTSTAKRQIEDLCAYREQYWDPMPSVLPRICILDPIKSDWWGITLSADGKRPALPFVILGGPHGHVPLSDTSGVAIGELVASGQLPMCILDMAYFKMGGLQRFYCDFAETLFRKNRGPLHLVIEEAHEFAPKERSGASGENMAVYWSKKLATAGRSKGLRLMLATQATQSLHNSLMGSCETLLAHRMSLPAHIEPVTKWLSAHLSKDGVEKIRADMPKLSNGQAYIVHEGYVERRQFKMMQTFDNTRTPDGTEIEAAPPPVDRSKLLEIVGNAVKEAEANDVDTLKARIKQLESDGPNVLTNDALHGQLDDAREAGHRAGFTEGHVAGRNWAVKAARNSLGEIVAEAHRQMSAIENNTSIGPDASARPGENDGHRASAASPPRAVASPADTTKAQAPTPATPRRVSKVEGASGPSNGSAAGVILLKALARIRTVDDALQLGVVSFMSSTSGYFRGGMKWIADCEYVEVSDAGIKITPRGDKYLTRFDNLNRRPFTRTEIISKWAEKLGGPSDRILLLLFDELGRSLAIQTIGSTLEMSATSGYFRKGVKRLRVSGLVSGDKSLDITRFIQGLSA